MSIWRSLRFAGQLASLAMLFATGRGDAARPGPLGSTSTGSITISASIAPRARISGSTDIAFGTAGGTSAEVSQDLCLSSNALTGSFALSAIGSGNAGALELASGRDTIGYTVELVPRDRPGTLDSATTDAGLVESSPDSGCDDGRGATSLIVALDPARRHDVKEGSPFVGALTLVVAPE
jgi:hypothetical protein